MAVIRSAFPQDDRIWRIQWLGHPILGNNPIEPEIPVLLVDPSQDATAPNARRACSISIGSLPVLEVGSLWQNGKRLPHPKYPVFQGKVDFDQMGMPVSTGHKIQESPPRYLIPPMDHGLGAGDWLSTYCLQVPTVRADCELIIPCTEILRTWYFRSRELVVRLCKGPLSLTENDIFHFERPRSKQTRKRSPLLLRKGMSTDDGLVAGLIAYDETAARHLQQATESIFRSISTKANSQRGIIAVPPAQGVQRIRACGQWLTSSSPQRFLVYRLLEVEYPKSIDEIEYNFEVDSRSDRETISSPEDSMKAPTDKSSPKTGIITRWVDEPTYKAAKLNEEYEAPQFFSRPKMTRLPAKPKVTVSRKSAKSRQSSSSQVHKQTVSTAQPGYADQAPNVLEIKPKIDRSPAMPRGLQTVLEISDEINQMGVYTCKPKGIYKPIVCTNGVPVSSFPVRNDEGYLIEQKWSLIDDRPRRLIALEISRGTSHFYCLEIESATTFEFYTLALVCQPGFEPIKESTFKNLLLTCVFSHGVWPDEKNYDGLRIKKLKHSRPTPAAFATAIIRQVKQWMGPISSGRKKSL